MPNLPTRTPKTTNAKDDWSYVVDNAGTTENKILDQNRYKPIITADTSTEIDIGFPLGNLCNMASANATTTYTLTDSSINGGWARVLINAASEPSVTGATKITGSTFAAATNMYLTVHNNGNRVEYWFETI